MLPLALVLVASLAPVGQAHAARERSPEEEALAAARTHEQEQLKKTKQEEREKLKQQEREERAAAREAQRESGKRATLHPIPNAREREHAVVTFDCDKVRWEWRGFRNQPDPYNTVSELVTIDHADGMHSDFTFAGASGSDTITFPMLPPGGYTIDAQGHWRHSTANGLSGGFDAHAPVKCPPAPGFSIEKLQQIEGSGGSPTKSPLTGVVGQTVDYEIVVRNTGNVPLTLGSFTDAHCEPGTVVEPDSATIGLGASATYTCKHVLTTADQTAGSYSNSASVVGTPPRGDGSPIPHESNEVKVDLAPPAPAFTIEKLQKIAGGGGSYTSSTLTGQVGETVDYEIVVRNTGNVALTLAGFTDPGCDAGTISGGPVGGLLAVGASTNYTCMHLLSTSDQSAGSHSNTVTLTGTPPPGDGSQVTNTSNTVLADVAASSQQGNGTPHGETTNSKSGSGSSGVLSATVNQSQSGVLAFSSATVPALKGPQGCVRGSFHVSIRSAGVASVTFYLDGRKLKTLTAKNAHKGLLTIEINPAKLKIGAHKLVARITMTHTASTRARQGSRSMTILHCRPAAVTPKFTG
ncbi:MAG: hypothetical protein ACLQBY_14720 [Solirubrobacteraceae bacterium]